MSDATREDVPPGNTTRLPRLDSGLAYDSLAPRYDNLAGLNPVLAHSARVSLGLVMAAMSRSSYVLEIGCGTGRETLEVARAGKQVVACDPSRESLEVLRRKASKLGLSERIETRALPASRIGELTAEVGEHAFEGAYASFSLSYEADLTAIPARVWTLLRPGSPFFCSIFNRLCLFEVIFFAPFLFPGRALHRLEGWMELPVDRRPVLVHSYAPRQVRHVFEPYFTSGGVWAIPAVIPPHYLHALVEWSGSLRPGWEAIDLRLNHRWPFKYLGSHTGYAFTARPQGIISVDGQTRR